MNKNKHTYVNIKKCAENCYYEVTITRVYDSIFGRQCKKVQKIPFIFRTAEIAKDFVSILPDIIEKTSIKKYKNNICYAFNISYETYKLSVGKYNVYIKWWNTENEKSIFNDIREISVIKTSDKVIGSFVRNIKITDYGDILFDDDYEKLSDLINSLEKQYGIIKYPQTEYNFELFEQ